MEKIFTIYEVDCFAFRFATVLYFDQIGLLLLFLQTMSILFVFFITYHNVWIWRPFSVSLLAVILLISELWLYVILKYVLKNNLNFHKAAWTHISLGSDTYIHYKLIMKQFPLTELKSVNLRLRTIYNWNYITYKLSFYLISNNFFLLLFNIITPF